jgi:hypothetical protein
LTAPRRASGILAATLAASAVATLALTILSLSSPALPATTGNGVPVTEVPDLRAGHHPVDGAAARGDLLLTDAHHH